MALGVRLKMRYQYPLSGAVLSETAVLSAVSLVSCGLRSSGHGASAATMVHLKIGTRKRRYLVPFWKASFSGEAERFNFQGVES